MKSVPADSAVSTAFRAHKYMDIRVTAVFGDPLRVSLEIDCSQHCNLVFVPLSPEPSLLGHHGVGAIGRDNHRRTVLVAMMVNHTDNVLPIFDYVTCQSGELELRTS